MIIEDEALEPFGWWPGGYTLRCPSCDERSYENGKRVARCRKCAEARYIIAQPASQTQIKSESNMIGSAEDRALDWNNGGDGHSVPGPSPLKSESKMDVKVGVGEIKQTVTTEVRLSRSDLEAILREHFKMPGGFISSDDIICDMMFIENAEVDVLGAFKRAGER